MPTMHEQSPRSPLFSLEVRRDYHGNAKLLLLDPKEKDQSSTPVLHTIRSTALPIARRRVFERLWDFSEQLDQKRIDLSTRNLRPLTEKFMEDMLELQFDVFGNGLPVIQKFVRKRSPHLLDLSRAADLDAPVVEILGGEDILFECFPIFSTNTPIAG